MKKIIFLLMLLVSQSLFAIDYDAVLQSIFNNSKDVESIRLQYKNGLINNSKYSLEDEVVINVDTGKITVYPTDTTTFTGSSVSVTLPNDGKTTISASLGGSLTYEDSTKNTLSTSLGASHVFDLNPEEETSVEDLDQSIASLSNEKTYQERLITFENQLLNQLKLIVNADKNIKKVERTLNTQKDKIKQNLETEYYAAGSLRHKNDCNMVDINENQLKYLYKQFEELKEEFKATTGIDYMLPPSLKDYDLTFNPVLEGNSGVVISGLNLDKAELKSALSDRIVNNIGLSGNASYNNQPNKFGGQTETLGFVGSAGFNYDNWKFSAGFTGNYILGEIPPSLDRFTPSLTIGASWSSKNNKDAKDLEKESLNNNLLLQQIAYQDARIDYMNQIDSLNLDIYEFKNREIKEKANSEYLLNALDYEKELYENGFKTSEDYETAKFNIELDKYDQMLLTIDGIILENKIKNLMI